MLVLLQLVLAAVVIAAVVWGVWVLTRPQTGLVAGPEPARLPARDREWLAEAISRARWVPAHDEVDGSTRVLVRRAYVGLDGRPEVLEERVLESFPADDPAWEALFTEAMAKARFRCNYLNAEEEE